MMIPYLGNQYLKLNYAKKISKKERVYLNFLLNEFINLKGDLIINEKKVEENFTIQLEDFFDVLTNISQKRCSYEIYQNDTIFLQGYFYLINNIELSAKDIKIQFNSILYEALNPDTIYYKSGLLTMLKFQNNSVLTLYNYFSKFIYDNIGEFEIKLQALKDILDVEARYSRFYDFERYVLRNLIAEINENSDFQFTYEKIKSGESKNSKVLNLKFNYKNIKEVELNNNINLIFNEIKNSINNFEKIRTLLYEYLNKNNLDYVQNNILFIQKHFDSDYDNILEDALKYDYNNNYFDKFLESETKNNYKLVSELQAKFSNLFEFETALYKELKNIGFYYEMDFLKKLYEFRKSNILEYENHEIKIIGEFKIKDLSQIQIYKTYK